MSRAPFIVIEGIDGAGTTTQLERLALALEARGIAVHRTCEPSSGAVGSLIRKYLRHEGPRSVGWDTMALLFAADRLDHVQGEIEPMLEKGRWVLSDRYDLSSLAYQSATSPEGGALDWIRELNARAPRPDLTLVIDVPPEVAEARRGARGGSAELYERRELQRRLAELYGEAERLVPGDRLAHVSGEGSAEEVAIRVLAAVDAALSAR